MIDNEHYSETGMQPTHTGRGVDFPASRRPAVSPPSDGLYRGGLDAAIGPLFKGASLMFCDIKVNTQRYPMSIRMRDGAHIKNRFRRICSARRLSIKRAGMIVRADQQDCRL